MDRHQLDGRADRAPPEDVDVPPPLGVCGQKPGLPQFDELVVDAGLREPACVTQSTGVPAPEGVDKHGLAKHPVQRALLVLDASPLRLPPD